MTDAAVIEIVRGGGVELVVDALRLYQDWDPLLSMAMQLLCPLCRHGRHRIRTLARTFVHHKGIHMESAASHEPWPDPVLPSSATYAHGVGYADEIFKRGSMPYDEWIIMYLCDR